MEDVPKSPRKARLEALLVMAKMVVALTDEEKGSLQWPGRTEVVEAMALLVTAKTAAQKAECAQNTLPDYSVSPDSVELESRDEAISPTIPWWLRKHPRLAD